jgi:hypothetical protein
MELLKGGRIGYQLMIDELLASSASLVRREGNWAEAEISVVLPCLEAS